MKEVWNFFKRERRRRSINIINLHAICKTPRIDVA